jgi:hypothetical protein
MLPFGVTIPVTVTQGSEIPEGLMNNPVYNAMAPLKVNMAQLVMQYQVNTAE